MHIVAHYDNSPNNKYNPNPNKTVYYGDMTWDEMMAPAYGLVVEDKTVDQKMVLKVKNLFLRTPALHISRQPAEAMLQPDALVSSSLLSRLLALTRGSSSRPIHLYPSVR